MSIVFACNVCRAPLTAADVQAGAMVRCPKCMTAQHVPAGQPEAVGASAGTGSTPPRGPSAGAFRPPPMVGVPSSGSAFKAAAGKRYGFNCGYCSSRLEATDSMGGQDGQCPTCGNAITIPILDRYGRLIDPKTRQIIKQDPHPVHAYAAAGERAPQILRLPNGSQVIKCPRCAAASPISTNNCKACGMPFTMEGTTVEAAGASNGFCVASLVLGIIGLAAFCTVVTPLLAIVFGAIGYAQATKNGTEAGGKGMAIAGIVCGCLGAVFAVFYYLK